MGRVTLGEIRDRSETIGDILDGSRDPRSGSGRFVGFSDKSWTGRRTLGEVQNGL